MDTSPLQRLLEKQEFTACVALARDLISAPDATQADKAVCYAHLCRALYKLHDYATSMEAGVIATHLAGEAKDYDLLGRALLYLAETQFYCGRPSDAVVSLGRFFEHKGRLGASRNLEGHALIDMGVSLRALGKYAEALAYFDKGWVWWRRLNPATAELCRTNLVWLHLALGNVPAAERLLPAGDEYVQVHSEDACAAARHLCDRANYLLHTGDLAGAAARAWECIGRAEPYPDTCSEALMTLAEVMLQERQRETAVALSILAKVAAEKATRPDLAAQAAHFLMNRLLQDPDAVERVTLAATGKRTAIAQGGDA